MFGKYKRPTVLPQNNKDTVDNKSGSSSNKKLKPVKCLYSKDIDDHMNYIFPGRQTGLHVDPSGLKYQIDINIMYPTDNEPYYVLYTQGMSNEDMILPDGVEKEYPEFRRAELFMILPADWDIENMVSAEPKHETYWPMQLMRIVARYHYEYFTWVAPGYTMEYSSFAPNTKLNSAILISLSDDVSVIETRENKPVSLYLVLPLYKEEVQYKIKHGYEKFIDMYTKKFSLDDAESWMVDINRKNLGE